jgi:hypothetical protein
MLSHEEELRLRLRRQLLLRGVASLQPREPFGETLRRAIAACFRRYRR